MPDLTSRQLQFSFIILLARKKSLTFNHTTESSNTFQKPFDFFFGWDLWICFRTEYKIFFSRERLSQSPCHGYVFYYSICNYIWLQRRPVYVYPKFWGKFMFIQKNGTYSNLNRFSHEIQNCSLCSVEYLLILSVTYLHKVVYFLSSIFFGGGTRGKILRCSIETEIDFENWQLKTAAYEGQQINGADTAQ